MFVEKFIKAKLFSIQNNFYFSNIFVFRQTRIIVYFLSISKSTKFEFFKSMYNSIKHSIRVSFSRFSFSFFRFSFYFFSIRFLFSTSFFLLFYLLTLSRIFRHLFISQLNWFHCRKNWNIYETTKTSSFFKKNEHVVKNCFKNVTWQSQWD